MKSNIIKATFKHIQYIVGFRKVIELYPLPPKLLLLNPWAQHSAKTGYNLAPEYAAMHSLNMKTNWIHHDSSWFIMIHLNHPPLFIKKHHATWPRIPVTHPGPQVARLPFVVPPTLRPVVLFLVPLLPLLIGPFLRLAGPGSRARCRLELPTELTTELQIWSLIAFVHATYCWFSCICDIWPEQITTSLIIPDALWEKT